MRFASVGTT